MTGCSAFGCSNRSEGGFRMLYFPRDRSKRAIWAAKVKRKDWKPSDRSCLCEVHFEASMWEKTRVDGKRKLKLNAIPTIFSYEEPPKRTKPPEQRNIEASPLRVEHTYALPSTKILVASTGESVFGDERSCTEISVPENITIMESRSPSLSATNINYQLELQKAKKIIAQHEKNIRTLKSKLVKVRHEKIMFQRMCSNLLNGIGRFLQKDQISYAVCKGKKVKKWSQTTIKNAIQLRFSCGNSGYRTLLEKKFPLPSMRTLRKHLQNGEF